MVEKPGKFEFWNLDLDIFGLYLLKHFRVSETVETSWSKNCPNSFKLMVQFLNLTVKKSNVPQNVHPMWFISLINLFQQVFTWDCPVQFWPSPKIEVVAGLPATFALCTVFFYWHWCHLNPNCNNDWHGNCKNRKTHVREVAWSLRELRCFCVKYDVSAWNPREVWTLIFDHYLQQLFST